MKKLAKLSPGRIFNFAGEKFVVMEQRDGAAFVLLAQSKESCPFNDKDDAENRNDYTHSTLKERIDKWVEALPRTSEEAAAILPFEVDLSCTDRSKSYGTITVKAAPLTLWQYGQFKELIPLNEDDWYWLATPWACRWLRSPLTNYTNYVWYVYSSGGYYGYYASYTIEGNTSNKCARRSYALNSAKIVGYGRPKYDGAGTTTPVTPTKPSAGGQTSGADYKIGDIVQFKGKTHYVSSQATSGVPCKPGKAKVTSIAKGAKHPYHLVNQGGGCTVYGWVNAADIGADSGAEQAVYTVVAGDSLWGIAQKRLGNGNRYKEIMTLNGLSSTVIRPGQKLKLPS